MSSESTLHLTTNPDDQRTFGPCSCCGNMTQRVWGYVNQGDATVAAYFVEWNPWHVETPANFDLILGKLGVEADAKDKKEWRLCSPRLKEAQHSWYWTLQSDRSGQIVSLLRP